MRRYRTGASEFELCSAAAGSANSAVVGATKSAGPAIVLALGGRVVVSDPAVDASIALEPTESAFVDHETSRWTLDLAPGATAYIAGLPSAVRLAREGDSPR